MPVGFGTPAGVPAPLDEHLVVHDEARTARKHDVVAESWMSVRAVASAHSLFAAALSPTLPSPVARVSETPPTETVVVALIVVVPGRGRADLTVHEPVPPVVRQKLLPTKLADAPPEFCSENVIWVPFGAFT